MSNHYYNAADLAKFGNIGEYQKELADKFFDWYGTAFADGALTAKEKSLIALAVAHAVQCPYSGVSKDEWKLNAIWSAPILLAE